MIAVYSENYTKPINTLCWQNAKLYRIFAERLLACYYVLVRLKLRHLLHRNAASLLVRHAAHFEQVRTVSWQMMGAFRAHKPTAIVRP